MITLRHITLDKILLEEWSVWSRPLPDNTQHSEDTYIPATRGIRTRNPNQRAAADTCLKPRGCRDRQARVTI